jgi:ADP-ribosylglycohydrolase
VSQDRARGALYGLAIGDALGMPAEGMTRQQVIQRWGPLLSGFEAAPPDSRFAAGLAAGSVTDDTEQAVLLGRLLVRGRGEIDPREWAAALVDWERDMAARGRRGLLGPSTKRAVAAILAGTPPQEAGAGGDTNGAAMRIAPVGIAFLPGDFSLADHVRQACLVTHNTPVAMAGALAVATAVSAGIWGASPEQAIHAAIGGARLTSRIPGDPSTSIPPPGSDASGVDTRIRQAASGARGLPPEQAASFIVEEVGTSLATIESVPAAFGVLSAVPDDPWQACLLAASLGGDADTIAAMAGAIAGACRGMSAFPQHAIATVDACGLDLTALADDLYALRGTLES